jgi:uncharacterized membrane protein YfcA
MIELSVLEWGLIAGAIFTAGVVDSIAGGGGLISLPALLGLGLPPAMALGTNKMVMSLGTSVASARFLKQKKRILN